MGKRWLYYVPFVMQREGKVGFLAHIVELEGPIKTPQDVWDLVETLVSRHGGEPQEGDDAPPVIPLGWTLISAQEGPAVRPGDNGAATESER